MKTGKLIVIAAPSGSGKTTIVKRLISEVSLNLRFSISATSRAKRENEVDGKDYHFLSVNEFKKKISLNEFIEWEEVYKNNFYGTLKSEIGSLNNSGKNLIFDIDVIGGLSIKKAFPENTLTIFIHPPSLKELESRLRNRGTESEEKIRMRLSKASKEMSMSVLYDHSVENNNIEQNGTRIGRTRKTQGKRSCYVSNAFLMLFLHFLMFSYIFLCFFASNFSVFPVAMFCPRVSELA